MNFKERLVHEYKDLIQKRTLLEKYLGLYDEEKPVIEKEEESLLYNQLEAMNRYEEILFARIRNMLRSDR
jgi:hypothetical protein